MAGSALLQTTTAAPLHGSGESTGFTEADLASGFLTLAFGADLQLGKSGDRIIRFEDPVRVYISESDGEIGQAIYRGVFEQFQRILSKRDANLAADPASANIRIHLIRQAQLPAFLETSLGIATARRFIEKNKPQCITRVQATEAGIIQRADVFITKDKGRTAWLDCAYHETLHAFGLLNHANDNPWTTLNQNRQVGYLSAYDRALLAILYHPQLWPGMSKAQAREVLPFIVRDVLRGSSK